MIFHITMRVKRYNKNEVSHEEYVGYVDVVNPGPQCPLAYALKGARTIDDKPLLAPLSQKDHEHFLNQAGGYHFFTSGKNVNIELRRRYDPSMRRTTAISFEVKKLSVTRLRPPPL